ncbi:hypothetical protein LTS09_002538 [Friedmanniomyces endolithicus]|nr:hypothetical protein LTS09_002538 [Friedmanniomyces endolithicus]
MFHLGSAIAVTAIGHVHLALSSPPSTLPLPPTQRLDDSECLSCLVNVYPAQNATNRVGRDESADLTHHTRESHVVTPQPPPNPAIIRKTINNLGTKPGGNNWMSGQHGASYPSVPSEEDVDSAATTLRASASSSKAQSLDGGLRREDGVGADIELEGWNGGGGRKRVSGGRGGEEDAEDTADDGDEAVGHENEHLLHSLDSTLDPILPLPPPPDKPRPVSWSSLPSKGQLAILTLSRLSEPLTQTSLQSYMFYQLKSFHAPSQPPPTDSTVAQQAGILAAAFTGAQMLTAVLWGRLADDERVGRKKVILIGLLGSAIGSLGFGFSRSFAMAVVWRAVGGILNGNIGVMRTLISEVVREKKYQSRAFLLLPMTFNIGVIIGPILGGLLADPVGSHPGWFGAEYQGWLARWPYALPNVVNAGFLVCSAMGVVFGLEETLEGLRGRMDWGLRVSGWVARRVFRRKTTGTGYEALAVGDGEEEGDIELVGASTLERNKITPPHRPTTTRRKLPFRRIWTPTVCFTLLAHGLLAMHVGSFNSLWFIFLSTPRYTPNSTNNDHNSTTLHLPPTTPRTPPSPSPAASPSHPRASAPPSPSWES